jgi:hypothetical protein
MGKISGVKPIIFSVHNTGISDEEAQTLAKYCDVVWACASKAVREIVGSRSKLQIGISIPVFGIAQMGKRRMKAILDYIDIGENKADFMNRVNQVSFFDVLSTRDRESIEAAEAEARRNIIKAFVPDWWDFVDRLEKL